MQEWWLTSVFQVAFHDSLSQARDLHTIEMLLLRTNIRLQMCGAVLLSTAVARGPHSQFLKIGCTPPPNLTPYKPAL